MPPKRKRSDRPSTEGGRPSPHRPADTNMAQHERDDSGVRGRGRHRGGLQRRDSSQGYGRGHGQQQQSPTRKSSNSFPQQSDSQNHQQNTMKPPPSTSLSATKQAPTPTQQPQQQSTAASSGYPPLKTSNYHYETITNDHIDKWAESSRAEVIQHGMQALQDVDITELSSLLLEFIHAVLDGRLSPSDAGACVKEILGDEKSDIIKDSYTFAPHTLFLDSLATLMENEPDAYHPVLRDFLMFTGVSPALMRQVLDAPILQSLGLIRETFARLGVRQATNLLYRQANYNLLREESEGYSKLISELFTTSTVPPPPPELAEHTFERVKALIGTFDLDVGRVLDVTLDVAAAVLIKQYKFFIKFLRISSWWPRSRPKSSDPAYSAGLPAWAHPSSTDWNMSPEDETAVAERKLASDIAFWDRAREAHLAAFFELGGRQRAGSADVSANGESTNSSLDFEQQWIKETNTLPPPGNRVAAQLLGFKLRYYNSDLRAAEDVLPANLLYLAALLIKVGFISLADLYPHLSPADDEMEQVREEETRKTELAERASKGGSMNALLMAGVLPQGDDDNPNAPKSQAPKKVEGEKTQTAVEEAETKPKLPAPLEQKVSLLTQLLTIGAIPESLFILGRFPWIPETFPDVLNRIHRILNVSVDKVYRDSRPKGTASMECPTKFIPEIDQSGVPKGSVKLTRLPAKKIWRWPFPDKYDTNENQTYRFYWDEWADQIPVCQTVDDIFTLCNTFLNISGVNMGKDETLLAKLASIGSKSMAEDRSEENHSRWHVLLKRLLLPSLSHTKANASVVNAVWELLKHFPTTTRYSLYAEWFEGQISRLPAMKAVFTRAMADTRGTMKRVSLTNLSEMAKQLAKTSYSSPGIVFRVAFEQLESYPNLIEAFVECAKYFTDLSYDVLVWSLMNSLGKSRSRTQAEHALTTSKWLQALSRFTGKVFRRYSLLDATPVLLYVNDQLFRGNSTDLIILKELISSMGGIVDSIDFTDYQVLSMAGGQALRKHTLIRAGDKRFDNVKSSSRLTQALADSHLAARLLVNLAQYRQAIIYKVPEDEAHIKYLSTIVDDSHKTFSQYLDFLWSNLGQSAFDASVPPIPTLMKDYGLDVSLAFLIGRASLAQRMFPWNAKEEDANKDKEKRAQAEADKEGDIAMSEKPNAEDELAEAVATVEDQKEDPSLIRSALQPLTQAVKETVDPDIWEKITPEFYTAFWALQLGDIFCPDDIYKQEGDRLKAEDLALLRDRSDTSRRSQEERNEKRKESMKLQVALLEERKEHYLRQAKWKLFLTKQFQSSFPNPSIKADAISDLLLEQCFLPRISMSPGDAEFTFRFIKSLHEWNAPGFKLMSLYNRLFNANRLRSLIFTCTVRETEHLGRFLKLVLEDLSRWHRNLPVRAEKGARDAKAQSQLGVYEKEGIGARDQPRLGFALTFDEEGKPMTFVEHAQFRDLLFGWHKNLNNALKSCLSGSEWMHIRNAITVLKTVVDFFPAVDFMATQFSTQLQKITQVEAAAKSSPESEVGDRVDLSVAAQGALSELQRRKSKWVLVQVFRTNAEIGAKPNADKPSNLRPTATDFTPGSSKPSPAKVAEEEDGEVQDGKLQQSGSSVQPGKESLPARPTRGGREPGRDENNSVSGHSRPSTPMGGARQDSRPHNLPTRPDVPIPAHYTPERFNQSRGHDRRDGRDSREPRGRDSRDQRDNRDSREKHDVRNSRNARQGPENERPERNRDNDRRTDDNHRGGEPPSRPRGSDQERGRDSRNGRSGDRPEEGAPASPAPQAPQTEQIEPMMNPERAALFAQDDGRPSKGPSNAEQHRPRNSEPASASTMDIVNPERAALVDRRDDNPSRSVRPDGRDRGPRPQSPRRGGRHGHEQDNFGPSAPFDDRHGRPHPPDHRGDGRMPRDDRPQGPGQYRGDKNMSRDFSGAPRGPDDRRHHPSYQDPNYGRLNPVPTGPETPSGPRPRGRGAARGGHGTPTGPDSRGDGRPGHDHSQPPSVERQPPTGPASGRGRRGHEPNGPASSGSPAAPQQDRQRNQGPGGDKGTPSSGVHPDRLANLDNNKVPPPPPPPGAPPNQGRRDMPDSGIPTGPAASNDRQRGGRRQLAGINNTLQSGSTPETGRGNMRQNQPRQMLGNSDVQVLAGGSQPSTPSQEPRQWVDAPKGPANDENAHGRGDQDRWRDNRQDRQHRHGRRSSRERESKDGSDHRDRRSGAGMEGGQGRDRQGGPGRGPEDWSGGRGPGRGGGLRPEDRHGREDRGRKRRSEEGVGNLSSDREKRARR